MNLNSFFPWNILSHVSHDWVTKKPWGEAIPSMGRHVIAASLGVYYNHRPNQVLLQI